MFWIYFIFQNFVISMYLLFFFSVLFTENRRVIILGDSIVKDLPPIDGVFIKSYPGATIAQLAMHIDNKHINLMNFDYIIVHVGTNNIDNRDEKGAMLSDFGNLIGRIKIKKPSIRIIVSSILPIPFDHTETDGMIKEINRVLNKEMGPDLGFRFVESWKAVCKFGTYRRYLFAKNDQGLHLNTEGKRRLRYFFLRVILTID